MPLLNTLKIEGDQARARIGPGESLLALSPATVAYGVTRGAPGAEPDKDAADERTARAAKRMVSGKKKQPSTLRTVLLFPMALFGTGPTIDPGDFPESWVGGRTCEGPPGSAARDMQRFLDKSSDGYVAVTEQRLVLLTRSSSGAQMSVAWAVQKSTVVSARRRPRLLARARFELRFADGSWVILSACPPHVGSWHAKQVVNALTRA